MHELKHIQVLKIPSLKPPIKSMLIKQRVFSHERLGAMKHISYTGDSHKPMLIEGHSEFKCGVFRTIEEDGLISSSKN